MFATIVAVCRLAVVPACPSSDSGSEPAADLAETEGPADEQDDDDAPVGETETETKTKTGPEPEDDGGETGDVVGETEDRGETEDDGTRGEEPPMAELDGDSEVNPAARAPFRATSPAPGSVDVPLFNDDAIDTRGLRYQGEVSNPGDQHDFVVFNIVPGQVRPVRSYVPGLRSARARVRLAPRQPLSRGRSLA